jgi:hypothetical protein
MTMVQFLPVIDGKGVKSQEKEQMNNVMSKILAANNHDIDVGKVCKWDDLDLNLSTKCWLYYTRLKSCFI